MSIYTTVQVNAANLINEKLHEKQEVERNIFIEEFNIPLRVWEKTKRQKLSKTIKYLNSIIKKNVPVFKTTPENIISSQGNVELTNSDPIPAHK